MDRPTEWDGTSSARTQETRVTATAPARTAARADRSYPRKMPGTRPPLRQ